MGDLTVKRTGATWLGIPTTRWALAAILPLGVAWGALTGAFAELNLVRILPYAVLLIGGYLLSAPGNQPLSPPRAVGVVAAALAADVLVLRALTVVQDSWLRSLAYYLVALLIARGNSIIGGIGAAVTLGYGLTWGVLTRAAPDAVVELLAVPLIAIVAGVIWRVVLRQMVARERLDRADAVRAELQARADAEAVEASRRELAEIARQARPLLDRIVAGEPLGELRVDLRVTEGAIRDRIRSPGLQRPILTDAIAERRRAGVDVLLLGEHATETPLTQDSIETIGALIAEADSGRVTVRILPPGRDAVASVVHQRGDGVRRTMIGADGAVLARV
ncbi:MAG: hypothetical protein GYA85_10825 [Propionibacterium sp.]|nr:hypothetical protein [Propionibacterium sp.]